MEEGYCLSPLAGGTFWELPFGRCVPRWAFLGLSLQGSLDVLMLWSQAGSLS